MKLSPNPVPLGQGLYCLFHPPTNSLYIGSSTNLRGRAYEWKAALKRGHFEHPPEEWEFRVIKRTEGMAYNELRKEEQKLIEHAQARGVKLLNRMTPTMTYNFEVDGLRGSATFHACRLGLNPKRVGERLRAGQSIEEALRVSDTPYDQRSAAIEQMSIKLTHEGKPVTYWEAAKIIQRQPSSIKERLKRMRRKNPDITEFPLENLLNYVLTPSPT